jgi:hypothetical protein
MKPIFETKKIERMKKDGEKWIDKDGYAHTRIDSYAVFEHRYIREKNNGKIPVDFMVHHKNGNKGDNRIENLEILSRKEHGHSHILPRIRIKYKTGNIKILPVTEKNIQFCKRTKGIVISNGN